MPVYSGSYLVVGDDPLFRAQFKHEDGTVIDGANCVATLRYRVNSNAAKTVVGTWDPTTEKFSAQMPEDDAGGGVGIFEAGTLYYEWTVEDQSSLFDWTGPLRQEFRRRIRARVG